MDVFGEIQAEDATVKFHFPFQLEMLEEGKEEFWDAMSNSESGAGSRPVSLRPGSTIYGSILYNSWRMSRPISVISTTSFDERQRNRQSRPISMQLEHPISRYYPVFTIAITVAIWLSFILGIVLSDELSLSSLGWHTPVSPPNVQWWFYTVGPFPSCTDERFKAWRLLSMQLVHSGLQHIGGNSACILIYGSVLEMYHPLSFLSTIIVFETAIAVGVLGYSALSPYTGLVGASPGAYGLIGACWYVAIAHRDLVDPVVAFVLPMVLAAQLAIDLLFFYVDFNPTTAYSSHIVGLVTGFVVAMTMTVTYRKISWGAIFTSLGGILVFSALVGLLLWHYLLFFPPSPLVSPLLHNLATRDACCHRLFALMDEYPHRSQASLAASMATCSDDY